jgi:uncharacterized protein affecting Mg2+/Co2+ transport
MFPEVREDSEPFIYESQTTVPAIPAQMSGCFTFEVLGEQGAEFDAIIDPFQLSLPPGQQLVDTPEGLLTLN